MCCVVSVLWSWTGQCAVVVCCGLGTAGQLTWRWRSVASRPPPRPAWYRWLSAGRPGPPSAFARWSHRWRCWCGTGGCSAPAGLRRCSASLRSQRDSGTQSQFCQTSSRLLRNIRISTHAFSEPFRCTMRIFLHCTDLPNFSTYITYNLKTLTKIVDGRFRSFFRQYSAPSNTIEQLPTETPSNDRPAVNTYVKHVTLSENKMPCNVARLHQGH